MSSPHGVVARITPNSLGEVLGLEPGDEIISINGHVLRDVIDFQFYGAEEELEILVRRGDEEYLLMVDRGYGEDLGIEFSELTFDGVRRCPNNCSFCFVKGMPPGMRPSLYVKDDDYRYAFLLGNFITLTNLREEDWARIGEQRLSPLYVSVHSTDQELRCRILGCSTVPDILSQLQRLGQMGIEVHTQVVLSPGLNDGEHLAKTVGDLAGLWPVVRSVGVVPVGLTRYQIEVGRTYRSDEARSLLDRIRTWQKGFRSDFGVNWVYASDEWYLLAGQAVPRAAAYDGYPQLENGIGLVRRLLDDWARVRHRALRFIPAQPLTFVCGTLIAPVLGRLAAALAEKAGTPVRVLPVVNRFFGSCITVSGLLTGRDVRAVLEVEQPQGRVFLPRSMFDGEGRLTLDDLTLEDLGRGLEAQLAVAADMSDVVQAVAEG